MVTKTFKPRIGATRLSDHSTVYGALNLQFTKFIGTSSSGMLNFRDTKHGLVSCGPEMAKRIRARFAYHNICTAAIDQGLAEASKQGGADEAKS